MFLKTLTTFVRSAAKQMKLAKSTASDMKARRLKVIARTQKNTPNFVRNEEERVNTGLRKVQNKVLYKVLVVDDDEYLHHDPCHVPGCQFYHSNEDDYYHKF